MNRIVYLFVIFFAMFFLPDTMYASTSLQEQIDAAKPGDTIFIKSGTYDEQLTISKRISLKAEGKVIILASKSAPALTIKNTENVVIENINVVGPNGHFAKKANGITLENTKNILLKNIHIKNVLDGIYIDKDQNSFIDTNIVAESRYGVHLMYSSGTVVVNNTFENNVTGIMHMMTKKSILHHNILTGHTSYNGFGIVLYDSEQILVTKNQLMNNQGAISIQQLKNTTITHNQIENNQIGVQFQSYDTSNEFLNNTFQNNIVSAISDNQGAKISENYWDDYSGTDIDEDGIGDMIYQSADSYAKLMIRKNEYQLYFQSPAIVTLNEMENDLMLLTKQAVVDKQPLMTGVNREVTINIAFIPLIISISTLLGGLAIWRKLSAS